MPDNPTTPPQPPEPEPPKPSEPPKLPELSRPPQQIAVDPLGYIQSLNYRWGDIQAVPYSKLNTNLFPDGFLVNLYNRTRASGRSYLGSLPSLFCGVMDLTLEGFLVYMQNKPLIILGEWRHKSSLLTQEFQPLGYTFITSSTQNKDSTRNSAFAGYCFFQDAWRTPEQRGLSFLGLAYLFQEFRLVSLLAQRYHTNKLSARWLRQFGWVEIAEIPDCMLWNHGDFRGELTSSVVSILRREVFTKILRTVLIEASKPEDN